MGRGTFEILSADIAVFTSGLGAWFVTDPRPTRGVVRWRIKGLTPWFANGLIPWFTAALAPWFASGLVPWAASSPIPWFGSRLVQQIGRELLARPFSRRQLLRACGTPSEASAGPLSLPVQSVPSSSRLWVGRYLTSWPAPTLPSPASGGG